MSYITNVLIHGSVRKEVEALNVWLAEADAERHQQFQEISFATAGGTKAYTDGVWAGAFNYGPVGELVAKLRDPDTWGHAVLMVAVIISGEEQSEAFVFDKVGGVYQRVIEQAFRW